MTPERLASLAAYAGDRLHADGPSGPYSFGPRIPVTARRAVYVVCAWSGRVLYVGSTTIGVGARFAQHLGDLTEDDRLGNRLHRATGRRHARRRGPPHRGLHRPRSRPRAQQGTAPDYLTAQDHLMLAGFRSAAP